MTLTKSEYLLFLKHPAWLWLKKHDKSKLPETSAQLQNLFDAGHIFEEYAEKLFPNAVKLGFSEYAQYLSLPTKTEEHLKNGTKTILQGRVEANNLTCIFDVLDNVGDGNFDLIEIKASTSAKVDHHIDLAFQLHVLESAGVVVRDIKVIHVNNKFVKNGEIKPEDITSTVDVTAEVRALEGFTKINIERALEVMTSEEMPSLSPRFAAGGALKEWMEVYKHIRGEHESHHIYNITSPNPVALGQLEDLHIENIADIPEDFNLNYKQRWQVMANKNGRHMNVEKIQQFIKSLEFPLYFLDYETLSGVIPPFDGLKPYQQLPFQYSLHILKNEKAELGHREFLHTSITNPLPTLLAQLKKDIGSAGTVLVWNESFEKGCNDLMGLLSPDYQEFLKSVNSRIKDLMTPFSKGWFVDKEFKGSASIKKVLPAIVSELSYKDLNIQEGGTAQGVWMETFLNGGNQDQKEQIKKDLLEYCKLDTLAMVEIYKVLKSVGNEQISLI